ncbi:MAG: LPS assembly lipoprotein LptE [Rariglobus sp.]|nr:LPS assembly lipoprotein LptE [Rariglobus sp.]
MRAILFIGFLGLLLSGCSNYHLGTGGHTTFRTLYVAPVVNENSNLPQAVAIVSTQIREAFLRDPRVILVNTPGEADATLSVSLVSYSRLAQTNQSTDTGLARKFDVTLNAEATLRDNRDNKVIFHDRKVQAVRQVFVDSGQLQAEYQNIPLLAEELGKNVLSATLDVW